MITYDSQAKQIHLYTRHNQLSIGILANGQLATLYFGEKIRHQSLSYVLENQKGASYLADADHVEGYQTEILPLLYPAYGNPDLRTPAFQLSYSNGNQLSDFHYLRHEIYAGKKQIPQLPSTFANEDEVTSVDIYLRDEVMQMELILSLSAFQQHDVFTQHVRLINASSQPVEIERLMSFNLDFLRDDFDMLYLTGGWARETQINWTRLHRGFQGIDSKRGAAGHGQNPFIALLDENTTYESGNVYSANLIYSGNFLADAEVDMYQNTRLQIGINPFNFKWQLAPGDIFDTPEAVFVYAANGLNEMSQRYHQFYLDCLMTSSYAKKERPILINNWEATYFHFDRSKLLELTMEAKKIGIELFVLDDGWFGKRDSDSTSLGDWVPNAAKLGGSLSSLIDEINGFGLDFGLWLEPEMVSKESDLYRQHPDWIIAEAGRTPHEARHQYVLDLSRSVVQDYIIDSISKLLSVNNIVYVKWDMNRNITDLGSRGLEANCSQELSHRYILGLYRVFEVLTHKFPEVLFESCAGGGGRFDPGMLYYTPQIWTSDDTDALERLAIQEGTSLIYPPAAMSCHVSAIPNHQVSRSTSLNMRALVSQQGNSGYELDLTKLTEEEKQTLKAQIDDYKKLRPVLQFGVQSKLTVNDAANEIAWCKVSAEMLVVTHIYRQAKPNVIPKRLKLTGLTPDEIYYLEGTNQSFSGGELMAIGLSLPNPSEDGLATQWILVRNKN